MTSNPISGCFRWKVAPGLGRRGGFTLLELLVVIAIMAILAGLVFAGFGGMKKTASRRKADAQIQAIGLALDMFARDNGEFPMNELDPESDPEAGSAVLYQALSGDGNDLLDFQVGDPASSIGEIGSSQKAYMKELDPQADGGGMVSEDSGGRYILVDPWRQPYRYVHYRDAAQRRQFQNRPASFDLYSVGDLEDEDSTSEENEDRWITNWD